MAKQFVFGALRDDDGSGTGEPGQDRAAIAVGIQASTGPLMAATMSVKFAKVDNGNKQHNTPYIEMEDRKMSQNTMIPPRRKNLDFSNIRFRSDGSRYVDICDRLKSQKVKDQIKAIENTKPKKAASDK